ncbi:lasso peptide biosynthesis B2 protein [Methanobacterium sp.]|uniref:lasso peptide biosynthesis B2 protein n=1 Tax=Methanobacterium sp. TaxID=2164 RepID=UPI002AB947FE|nr:lasso peptide biosynthesis B2 protein [Methanobacterium sp.]MDY9922937.1 lasso peptide biosynthesis B2 protein [Methanobacterium sp.]
MRIISSFIKLPSRDKLVVIEALFWVIVIRLMVWIFPFKFVQKRVQKIASYLSSDRASPVSMSRLRVMIVIVSRYVPRATCLVQALAGYILFSKYGYTTSIKIGVLNENGEFEAHAWLENDNGVVLGESEKDFKIIMDIK